VKVELHDSSHRYFTDASGQFDLPASLSLVQTVCIVWAPEPVLTMRGKLKMRASIAASRRFVVQNPI
jgi:hypothetical protein